LADKSDIITYSVRITHDSRLATIDRPDPTSMLYNDVRSGVGMKVKDDDFSAGSVSDRVPAGVSHAGALNIGGAVDKIRHYRRMIQWEWCSLKLEAAKVLKEHIIDAGIGWVSSGGGLRSQLPGTISERSIKIILSLETYVLVPVVLSYIDGETNVV
jgi:hypothetical protein